jgi:hypothetical protein
LEAKRSVRKHRYQKEDPPGGSGDAPSPRSGSPLQSSSFWDDWGGWFDPVKPVYEDYDGLGFRVPLIVVSPYARKGHVTHRQYETASVLRYIEDTFGLASLAQADRRASDPSQDAFNYGQIPRKFERVPGGQPTRYWLHLERSSTRHGQPKTYVGDD